MSAEFEERRPLSLAEKIYPKWKCLERVATFQEAVKSLGSDCRRADSDDNGFVDWDKIFKNSLLGARLGYKVDTSVLTGEEQKLLPDIVDRKKVLLLVFCDVDGVLVSPAHDWKRSGRTDLITGLGFKETLTVADATFLRTSRFPVPQELLESVTLRKLLEPFLRGDLYRFPFIDSSVQNEFAQITPDRFILQGNKPILGHDELLDATAKTVLNSEDVDRTLIYSLISSMKDEREAVSWLKRYPKLAPRIVFFDTCHYYW